MSRRNRHWPPRRNRPSPWSRKNLLLPRHRRHAKSSEGPTTRSTQKPISGPPKTAALETYPELGGLAPAERTLKLVAALYLDRNLPYVGRSSQTVDMRTAWEGRPTPAGQPVRLIDCLRSAPTSNRAKTIEAYWTARQIAAQYQSFVEQVQWLEALGPTLSAENPPSPLAMLKLRTARLGVEAQRADAEADWRVARFELAGHDRFWKRKYSSPTGFHPLRRPISAA